MTIEITSLPSLRVAAVRRVGPYGPDVKQAFERLTGWAGSNGVFNGGGAIVIGAYYSDPKSTPPEQCVMEACVTLAPDQNPKLEPGVEIKTLPGGKVAMALGNVYNDDFCGAWQKFIEAMAKEKLECDGASGRPCLELYYGGCAQHHPLKKWVVDFVSPIR